MPRVQTRLSQRTANKRRAKSRNVNIGRPVPGTEVSKKLTHGDIQDFLVGCAAAIELDQIRVDALPIEKFHPLYEDGMWRRHRNLHLVFINQLLATVNEIPPVTLEALTRLAITYEASVVREAVLEVFSYAATGEGVEEGIEKAAVFFDWLIKDVSRSAPARSIIGEPRGLMMQWLAVTDPLRIAEDKECGYGRPVGFVN
jgi:hypothetical protein